MKKTVEIRPATQEDIPEITALFRATIPHVTSKHFSEKQMNVWASGADDIEAWEKRIQKLYFIVAQIDTNMVGFGYLKNGNFIEGLYVQKDYKRQGIGSKLLRIMESQAMMNDYDVLKSDINKTAIPFFDNRYFEVIKKHKKNYKGVIFENYLVEKNL
ncbi:GNAT family N-acetyltransferase [Winogradskyella sediminis]|uniref:Putative acetyltransferase n=1 Tax=Winogradskyella sediminis TaxID=1382466 RepID=A0A1H1P2A0_9FLAO|nr:GNAT family N-acetyltransferase [Winogradskyella sediminis]SDS05334.1 putative acetyltransferase [Winogradskyella sediminis]